MFIQSLLGFVYFTSTVFLPPWTLHVIDGFPTIVFVQFLVFPVLADLSFVPVGSIKHGVCSISTFATVMVSSLVTGAFRGLLSCSA